MITITFEGRIPSKKNSRVKPRNCNFTIPSPEYFEWQDYARWQARLAWRKPPTGKPVTLRVVTSCRNDIDNLMTSVMDAMEGIIYHDDKQVVTVGGKKVPKDGPYMTVVEVEIMDG
ncbi:MAG: RusA family crossover junction endodeoxyribonuclease [bacterium]